MTEAEKAVQDRFMHILRAAVTTKPEKPRKASASPKAKRPKAKRRTARPTGS